MAGHGQVRALGAPLSSELRPGAAGCGRGHRAAAVGTADSQRHRAAAGDTALPPRRVCYSWSHGAAAGVTMAQPRSLCNGWGQRAVLGDSVL